MKKPGAETPFDRYLAALPCKEGEAVSGFFREVDRHILLPRQEAEALREDFRRALLWYAREGVATEEALERLNPVNLGGFYARPATVWYPLDDAAKIYPLSMKRGQMAVFRLSAYLREPVAPELLQLALTFTIKRFPGFAVTVKKGFFWHYLDSTKRRYPVSVDTGLPCRPIVISGSGSPAFRVLVWENRISVEFFHILTDGTGGLCFLKTLTAEYLRLAGHPVGYSLGVANPNGLPRAEETENSFLRAQAGSLGKGFLDKPALQLGGALAADRPWRVLHFRLDAAALQAVAKARGATVTAYLLSVLFAAGRYAAEDTAGEFSIQVPVNMRRFHPSETLRNFSLYCGIRIPGAEIGEPEALLPEITRQLEEKASATAMEAMLASTGALVGALRWLPLFIKAPAARVVYGFLGDRIFSNTLSNLGRVSLPPEMAEQVESLDFVLGTALTNRAGCGLVTCGGIATLSVTKMTADPSFEEELYALLERDGLSSRVEGSIPV